MWTRGMVMGVPVRDVFIGGKKRKAGIYFREGVPAEGIEPGVRYYAKIDGKYIPVETGQRNKMYPVNE